MNKNITVLKYNEINEHNRKKSKLIYAVPKIVIQDQYEEYEYRIKYEMIEKRSDKL